MGWIDRPAPGPVWAIHGNSPWAPSQMLQMSRSVSGGVSAHSSDSLARRQHVHVDSDTEFLVEKGSSRKTSQVERISSAHRVNLQPNSWETGPDRHDGPAKATECQKVVPCPSPRTCFDLREPAYVRIAANFRIDPGLPVAAASICGRDCCGLRTGGSVWGVSGGKSYADFLLRTSFDIILRFSAMVSRRCCSMPNLNDCSTKSM